MIRRAVDDRLIFAQAGHQTKFILEAQTNLGLSPLDLAELLKVHPRTLRGWIKEKHKMSAIAAQQLCHLSGVKLPSTARKESWIAHLSRIGSQGGRALWDKYGQIGSDPEYRKLRWQQWWETKGKFIEHPILYQRLPIRKPKPSVKLAELVGILLGDGGITNTQVSITLHRIDDAAYSIFVKNLVQTLFNVPIGIHHVKNALADTLVISRTELVSYLVNQMGLKIGNKVQQQIDIPSWIKGNDKYQIACIRGLVDTDGCVFTHRYKVNGKIYSYKKMSFTSASQPLRQSVFEIFRKLGFQTRIGRNKDVRLDSKRSVSDYFRVIGSHNPKHLNRYHQ